MRVCAICNRFPPHKRARPIHTARLKTATTQRKKVFEWKAQVPREAAVLLKNGVKFQESVHIDVLKVTSLPFRGCHPPAPSEKRHLVALLSELAVVPTTQ
uniref:Uncharacterized protein n=1 Tax=Photinus pyralis TaxID=7054 RepID=A0A1Y1LR00_PHOPY